MSYHSKRTLASIFFGCCLVAAYVFYVFGMRPEVANDLAAWARVVLAFIGSGVIGAIIVHLLTLVNYSVKVSAEERHLSDQEVNRVVNDTLVEDEMDKLIGLRASRIGYYLAGFSLIVAIAALALGVFPFAAFHIVLGGFFLGSLVEGIMSIYLYEKGVQHG